MPNNIDAFVPEIWSRHIIANIDQVNVALAVMTNTDYEGEVRNAGDTVQVRTFGSITVQDYARGTPIAAESLVPTKEAMTIDKAKYFAFDVDSLDVAQNDINAVDGYTQRAGVAMSNAIDAYVFGLALAGAGNAVGTTSAPINITHSTDTTSVYQQIVYAGLDLDQQDVVSEGRWIIISPYAKSLLLQDTTHFVRASALGDAVVQSGRIGMTVGGAMQRGYLGQVGSMDVWVSNKVPTNGTYWACPYGQGRPIAYAAQIPPSTLEAIRLETTFATRVRGLLLHGGKVFTEDAKRLGILYIDNS
jgi:hypothetical protein